MNEAAEATETFLDAANSSVESSCRIVPAMILVNLGHVS